MSIFDNEANLPGVITEVEADYSYGYDTSLFGTTDSVVVIGTAFNGPVGVATPVYSKEHAAYIFGGVYDSVKKQESTLVANIYDAWDRGCRTIYAVRVSGIDLYKDFEFRVDNGFKLRVSAMYPSNLGKDYAVFYNNTKGAETITFFKPADRATISEKKQGMVTSSTAILSTEIFLAQDRAINFDTPLVEMIKVFNAHPYNNVITLAIVNDKGVDVTDSPEAYTIPLGAMYPGAYLIGRNRNTSDCAKRTVSQFCIPGDGNTLPYSNFSEAYFRKLTLNTDVSQPLPIYAAKIDTLRQILKPASITMIEDYDFLTQTNVMDRAWEKDSVDYEETALSSFELYQRLGDGYAITAHAERRVRDNGDGTFTELAPRIRETDTDDRNRIQPIKDGIYSILQDAEIKYRVLSCAYADQKISSKLPRAKDFRKVIAKDVAIMPVHLYDAITTSPKVSPDTEVIKLTAKLNDTKMETPMYYKIVIEDSSSLDIDNDAIYRNNILDYATYMDGDSVALGVDGKIVVPEGTLVITDGSTSGPELYQSGTDGILEECTSAYAGHYVLAMNGPSDFDNQVYSIKDPGGAGTPEAHNLFLEGYLGTNTLNYSLATLHGVIYVVDRADGTLIGDYASLCVEDPDDVQITAVAASLPQTKYDANGKAEPDSISGNIVPIGLIKISSKIFTNITIGELVDAINSHKVLSKYFNAELTSEGNEHRDDFVLVNSADFADGLPIFTDTDESVVFEDREAGYDYSLYIPYRTTDNFARQLAQHCTYTELKTIPTHGVIGCKRLVNVGLKSVANKLTELIDTDFDLYAKTDYGRYILDANNLAYPIGKNISIIFEQHKVTLGNFNYVYNATGAAAYGAMVSTLPLDQSSTSQAIALTETDFNLTQYQLSRLTSKGIVTVRRSFTKGLVVTDGITMAPVDSVFRRLNVSRIIGAVEEIIRTAAEPFIGKQNHTANRNALQTAIKSNLNKIVGTLIEAYDFKMNTDPQILKFNYIDIAYKIIPIYEIREVRNTIKVTDNLTK